MTENEILAMYEDAGALLNGHFILSSGRHSARYLQSALVLMHPRNAEALAAELIAKIKPDAFDLVVSPAIGGLVIGQEVARQLNKPFMFTERKDGIMQLRRGFSIPDGARVLVVEDVITTGGSVRECMQVIRKHGGIPVQILAVVDRAPDQSARFDVPCATALALNVETYAPEECPLCREGVLPAVKPGSRGNA
ncbi:MAG: orotate phosphoribosyltransferase [Zetaproteobacteria bacterium]|nr:MAG: orotate phosphoribosyltransferase [Zetaproteobacteria bacterium]